MNRTYNEPVKETFSFPLTEQELLAKGQEASSLHTEILQREYDLSIYKKARKAEIDTLASKRNQFLKIMNAKSEDRVVDCQKVYDFASKRISYLFRGEIMLEREMNQFETSAEHSFSQSLNPSVAPAQ